MCYFFFARIFTAPEGYGGACQKTESGLFLCEEGVKAGANDLKCESSLERRFPHDEARKTTEYSAFLAEIDTTQQVWLCLRFLSKNGLTDMGVFAILYKLSRGTEFKTTAANLENDTEKREKYVKPTREDRSKGQERGGETRTVRILRE